MSESLRRHAGLDEFTLERLSGVDGQGLPAYDSPISGEGVVRREVAVVRNGRGEEVRAIATLYVDGASEAIANENDRVVVRDDVLVGIVVATMTIRALQTNEVDHVEVHLRNE